MIENLDRYRELINRLEEDKLLLHKLGGDSSSLKCEFDNNKMVIDNLTNENKELNKKIKRIVNRKIFVANIFLKLFSLIFIITSIMGIAVLSNFNIVSLFLSSMITPIAAIYVNYIVTKKLEKLYRKKDNKIVMMEILINENMEKIKTYTEKNDALMEIMIKVANDYDKVQNKIKLMETAIDEMKIDQATPLFEEVLDEKATDEIKPFTKKKEL